MFLQGMTVYEANVDLLNGVSYDKGCYLGQETVARGTVNEERSDCELRGSDGLW